MSNYFDQFDNGNYFDQFDTSPISKAESLARGLLQGASFGTSDEIYGGMRSLTRDVSRAIERGVYGDTMLSPISYRDARNAAKKANEAAQSANPKSYLAGEITGAVGTGAAGATTKAGAAIARFVRSGKAAKGSGAVARGQSLALRGAKGAAVAAPSGALYGAGVAREGERIKGARVGAQYAGAVGAAGPVALAAGTGLVKGGKTALKGAKALDDEARNAVRKQFDHAASTHYKAVRDAGAALEPKKAKGLIRFIDNELATRGRLNSTLHPKTMALLDNMKQDLSEGILDIERIDQARRSLSRVKKTADNAEDFGAAQAVVRVINKFEDTLKQHDFIKGSPDVVKQLKLGRNASHKAMKVAKISDIIRKADGDPHKIKAGLTRFVTDKRNVDKYGKLIGFSEDEALALMEAARTSSAEKLYKMGGKFGIDLGNSLTPGNTALPIIGSAIAGSGGGAATVVGTGTVMRQLQKYMARGKADDVIRAIEAGHVPKELMRLPPKEAKAILESLRGGGNMALSQEAVRTSQGVYGK